MDILFKNIGEVIGKANESKKMKIIPEKKYYDGRDRKDTVDWIVYDEKAALFIECKSKKMVIPAKTSLNDEKPLLSDLAKMADFIVQVYKTINDYSNNK